MFSFYMDESGFTGEDLLNAQQPFFVHASTTLTDEESASLRDEFFADIQAPEIKHTNLSKHRRGRRRVVAFLEAVHDRKDKFTTFVIHKEFTLLTYLIDLWVESLAHVDGVDLYRDGCALAMSNMTFYCLNGFEGDAFLKSHLRRFQCMMTDRTFKNFETFFGSIEGSFRESRKETQQILAPILAAGMRLGYRRLQEIPERAIDPAFTTAVQTASHWRKLTTEPLRLVHDASSSLAKDKWLWDWITSPRIEPRVVGGSGQKTIYPINVEKTEFPDSKEYIQLQLCDIIAGASMAWCRGFVGMAANDEYFKQLESAGIREFIIGKIWPSPEVDPEKLGTKGWSGEEVEFLTSQLAKAEKS